MRTRYELRMKCRCPVDPAVEDEYEVTVVAERMIKVEDIRAVVGSMSEVVEYQESITTALAKALTAEVTTVGVHSGVKTTCTCA